MCWLEMVWCGVAAGSGGGWVIGAVAGLVLLRVLCVNGHVCTCFGDGSMYQRYNLFVAV